MQTYYVQLRASSKSYSDFPLKYKTNLLNINQILNHIDYRIMTRRFIFLILALFALISGPGWGQAREGLTLTFDLSSNPGGWPTANSTTLTEYTYTLNNVDYTFALKNVKCNSGYLMLTATAVLGLPAIEDYKLTKVVAKNSGGCSTSTKVGISSSATSESYISGGEIQTWSITSSSYTYNLTGTDVNTMYYLYVTNKNAQVTTLTLTYEGSDTPDKTLISLAISGTPTKTEYETGEEFDPAGLVVTGTYDDESTADLTNAADWTFDPATFTSTSQTSVSVTATVGDITSPAYTINGLTVTEHVQTYANTYTSNVELTTAGGTSASAAKVKWENVEYNALKCGTSSAAGACIVTIPANTQTLHFHAAGWNGETVVLNETFNLVADGGVSGNSPFSLQNDPETKDYFTLDPQGATSITFSATSGKRFVLFGVNAEEATTHTLTFSATNGSISAMNGSTEIISGNNVAEGAELDITATANAGYEFVSWNVTGTGSHVEDATSANTIFTMGTEDAELTATFQQNTTEYTVTCNDPGNGNTISANPTSAVSGSEITLTATAATEPAPGYRFTTWTVISSNGQPVEVENNKFIMPASDVTVTGAFAQLHNITISDAIQNGIVTADKTAAIEDETITLTITPAEGYVLGTISVKGEEITGTTFTMPDENVTVSATFENVVTYTRINNIDDLIVSKHYIIVGENEGTYYAMGGQKSDNRDAVEIEATEAKVQVPASTSMQEFTISGDPANKYTFYDLDASGFLYAASSSSNYLRTKETLEDNGRWTIEINGETGAATIKAQGDNSRNMMRFNSSSELFSCYSGGQQPVYLYMKENDINNNIYSDTYIDGDISNCLFFSVGKGAALTVTGTIDENIAMFSIVDGAQLIYDNDIPKGTIGNRFRKYADDEADQRTAWNLVSVPVKNFNLLPGINITGDYDLYSYNEPTHFWINKKEPANPYIQTTIGTGYLFAMPLSNTHARFGGTGILQGSGQDLSFPLSYTETLADGETNVLKGFNLVGNPFTCNAYVNMDYLVLDETGSNFVNPTSPIKPGDAILVQATAEGQEITFTRNAPTEPENRLDISVSQNRGSIIDNARIRFGGSHAMNKFYLNENSTRLYIPQDGQDFAIVSSSTMEGELPVNFKAEKNGTFTITVNTKNVDAEYLHLIDNMTGMDIDLLATDSYTFDALTNDYAYRFKLVFGMTGVEENALTSSANFAYISNGNLVIDNIECETTLKIVDELGRIISTETVNGSYNKALNLKAGLYIINLNGMTQKIVVE